jgi:hypothetical protein
MRIVLYVLMAVGALVAGLGIAKGLLSLGGHGVFVVVCGLVPVALGALAIARKGAFPRWAAGLSLVFFLLAGMKTSGADSLAAIMVMAFVGMLVAVALLLKPPRVLT